MSSGLSVNQVRTRVRCILRSALEQSASEDDATNKLAQGLQALNVPIIATAVMFFGKWPRHGEVGILLDGQPELFEIRTWQNHSIEEEKHKKIRES